MSLCFFFQGVLSKGRADSLRQMPLQECDVLLHEAGAPPIHTPISVLQNLPETIKERLYVVHTSALPPDSSLRVAPTGTSGTIRLDKMKNSSNEDDVVESSITLNSWSTYGRANNSGGATQRGISYEDKVEIPPDVMRRPACIADAWFVLNLISNVPFFAGLSYLHTMEVLEVASIEVFTAGEIVIPARKRQDILCIIWEGTCTEQGLEPPLEDFASAVVWHAGDWTGPIALQPDIDLAAKTSANEQPKNIVALSAQGVKVISLLMTELDKILMRGSKLYRKYMGIEEKYGAGDWICSNDMAAHVQARGENPASRLVLDSLKINSLLGSLYASQIRALESIADGPRVFHAGDYLWKAGDPCNFAYLIAAGSATFRPPLNRTRSIRFERSPARQASTCNVMEVEGGNVIDVDKVLHDLPLDSEYARLDLLMALRSERMASDPDYRSPDRLGRKSYHKHSDRNANKVFARLNASRKCIGGLVVSRGCFLCDTSRMISGDLVYESDGASNLHLHT